MGEYQGNLKIEILKEGYENIKETVMQGLSAKSKFIEAQYQKELSPQIIKRVNIESEHIKNCIALIDSFENLIEQLEKDLNVQRTKTVFAFEESKDYLDKYFATTLTVNKLLNEAENIKRGYFKQD